MNKLYKIPLYILSYKFCSMAGWPRILPISLALSVTNKCKSRCKTCNLWNLPSGKDFTVEEWKKVFKGLGKQIMWLTFSGGDQFLRKDFYKIVNHAIRITKPCLVNIPLSNKDVNGTLKQVTKVLKCSKTPLIINLSIDGDEKVHDFIRGVKGSFRATIETFYRLKSLKTAFPQLFVCFNTIVSKYNAKKLNSLHKIVSKLQPDYWMLEPFQCRAEFGNINEHSILDDQNVFLKIKDFDTNRKVPNKAVLKTKHIVRQVYYHFAEKTLLKNKMTIPCYAAIASIQISPEGHVWQCGTKCGILGSLRESGYDFRKIFFSKRADQVRKEIKEKKCFCIQCNTFYTNLICNPSSFARYFLMKVTRLKC